MNKRSSIFSWCNLFLHCVNFVDILFFILLPYGCCSHDKSQETVIFVSAFRSPQKKTSGFVALVLLIITSMAGNHKVSRSQYCKDYKILSIIFVSFIHDNIKKPALVRNLTLRLPSSKRCMLFILKPIMSY